MPKLTCQLLDIPVAIAPPHTPLQTTGSAESSCSVLMEATGTFVQTNGGTIVVNDSYGSPDPTLSSEKERRRDYEFVHRVLEQRLNNLQGPTSGAGTKSRFRIESEVRMDLEIERMKVALIAISSSSSVEPELVLPPQFHSSVQGSTCPAIAVPTHGYASEAPKRRNTEPFAGGRLPRLIDTVSLKIRDFTSDESIPDYAILSHRWTGGEISYRDYAGIQDNFWPPYSLAVNGMLPGYVKIVHACRRAHMDGIRWIWIDTCCIDQDDIFDLARNIKSMYTFYENSRICYAYLLDVTTQSNGRTGGGRGGSIHQLEESEWFRRGWTLQELLAPKEVILVDRDWNEIERRNNLADILSTITLIPAVVIRGEVSLQSVNLIKRLCWSNNRRTAKPEDMAYCLLGILGVVIEPMYGEGVEHAFERIRKELIDMYPGSWRELEGVNLYNMIPVWSYYSRMLVDETDTGWQ